MTEEMKMRVWLGGVVIASIVAIALVGATGAQAPPTWEELKVTITARNPEVPWIRAAALDRWLREEPKPLLLDARAPAEYRVSHLEDAVWVDPDRPDLEALRPHRDRRTVVYCSVGWRSGDVAAALRRDGWREVYNLEGGLFSWANADRPIVGPRAPAVHPFDARWGRLLRADLRIPLGE